MNAKTEIRDQLTNKAIAENYRDIEIWLMRKDFTGSFADWVVQQSPYEAPDITEALTEFNDYVTFLLEGETCKQFSYDKLNAAISEERFEKLPAVLALNVARVSGAGYTNRHTMPHPDYDFIDLGALARNIFYSIVRRSILA